MNDASLKKTLEKLVVPVPDDSAMGKARHRAEIAFANRYTHSDLPSVQSHGRHWMATLCVGFVSAVVICLGWFHLPASAMHEGSDRKLLAEMEALFPGQLDGVIATGNYVSLDLSPTAWTEAGRSSQPLAMTLKRGRQIVRVLGYSGRKVCVNLGGRKHCLEPLVTAEGKVIVEGDDFLWTNNRPVSVAGYKLEARTLTL